MSTSTILPASGHEYLCVHNRNDPSRFVQVRIVSWLLKSDTTQPIPITPFGPAENDRSIPIAQHWPDGEGSGTYYLLPNGPFFVDPPSGKFGQSGMEQMRSWLANQQPPERV